jgi:WD40 repeat protein
MAKDRDYIAFISYRHQPADCRWAQWLHRSLETYRLPAALARELKRSDRLGTVFRDEEELAASPNLSADIEQALRASRYLIVVCSRATPASRWINEEVQRFQTLGRSKQILALLIDGDPDTAYPPALRAAGVEPRAADVRSNPVATTLTQRLRDLLSRRRRDQTELWRLIASMLDIHFDALRNREQERVIRRRTLLAGGAAAVMVAMLVLALAAVAQWALASQRLGQMAFENARQSWVAGNPDAANQYLNQARENGFNDPAVSVLAQQIARVGLTPLSGLDEVTTACCVGLSQGGEALVVMDSYSEGLSVYDVSGNTARLLQHFNTWLPPQEPGDTCELPASLFSPTGDRVLALDEEGRLGIWGTRDERPQVLLLPEAESVASAAFSPTGRFVAARLANGVRLWNDDGMLLRALTGAESYQWDRTRDVLAVHYSARTEVWTLDAEPPSRTSVNGRTEDFNATTRLGLFRGAGRFSVRSMDDGQVVAEVIGTAGQLSDDGTRVLAFDGRSASIIPIQDSNDDTSLDADDSDVGVTPLGSFSLWERRSTRPRFAAGGRFVITGGNVATIWAGVSGHRIRDINPEQSSYGVSEVVMSRSGRRLLTLENQLIGGGTTSLRVYALMPAPLVAAVPGNRLACSRDEALVAVSDGTSLRLVDAMSGDVRSTTVEDSEVTAIATCPNSPLLVTAHDDRTIRVRQLRPPLGPPSLVVKDVEVESLVCTTSDLIVANSEGKLRSWRASDGTELPVRDEHVDQFVGSVGVCGTTVTKAVATATLGTGQLHRWIQTWNFADGALVPAKSGDEEPEHEADGWHFDLDADGDGVFADFGNGRTRVRRVCPAGAPPVDLAGHAARVEATQLLSDGRLIATGSRDWTIRLWSTQTAQMLAVLEGHHGGVSRVCAVAGERRLASLGADGMVRFWDMAGESSDASPNDRWSPTRTVMGWALALGRWINDVVS